MLVPGETAPTIDIQVLAVEGATGPFGNAQPGDALAVTFRLAKDDGTLWRIDEFSRGRAVISGPTTNYQRVVELQTDVRSAAVDHGDGTYTYTFPPIPETYVAPYNDTASFDADDGELAGQPLLDGTYTAALWFEWTYMVSGASFGEVGTRLVEFVLGDTALPVEPRQVVTTANCNQCHGELEFHGGHRKMNETCVLCHTAGAEDRNNPAVAGGTPGVSIEMSVMIHRIHNGAHLPSVLGVTTDPMDGTRDYTATPQPYQIMGFGDELHDYSHVAFPAWPNLAAPMPRDSGYDDLELDGEPVDAQALEDAIRSGVTSCNLCHGDPDGDSGPLAAPAQGDFAYTVQRRNTCGSCHDDWIHDELYTSNMQTMPAQFDDDNCTFCHVAPGSNLDAEAAHLHPLLDPAFATGVNFEILGVARAGGADGGNIDVGDRVAVTFTVTDDLGADIDAATLSRHNIMVAGPTWNLNALTPEMSIPAAVLSGPQPYTVNVPERVYLEQIGVATDGADAFGTLRTPHWNAGAEDTEVYEVTAVGGASSVTTAAVTTPVNYVDVDDATGFAHDEYVVLDLGGGNQEYLRIQTVDEDADRLWFSSPATTAYAPGPRNDHAPGTTVDEVTLVQLVQDTDYMLDTGTGTITEIAGAFGDDNPIVVTYTTEWIVPDAYPLALNAGPDLDETDGGWAGKSLVEGTYTVGMWGHVARQLMLFGETNSYNDGGQGVRAEFLIGDSVSMLEPYDNITSAANCYDCHVDIQFHGNNRTGFDSCLLCHGTAASGDRPYYVAPNAPATDGATINFREMLHKIHAGAELHEADDYMLVGFGQGYPDNFSVHTYEEVHFPAMPAGTQDCTTCHGAASLAWTEPDAREHPTEQGLAVQEWTIVCGACHDSPSAQAHIQTQSSPITGAESCLTCHGEGQTWNVALMHQVR